MHDGHKHKLFSHTQVQYLFENNLIFFEPETSPNKR